MVGIRPSRSGQPFCRHPVRRILLADDSTHLADGLHTADQVLLHRHFQIPPKMRLVFGKGLRIVSSALVLQKLFAGLFTDDSTHLADGLHTEDQILLHRHNMLPPIVWSGKSEIKPVQILTMLIIKVQYLLMFHIVFHSLIPPTAMCCF